MKVEISLHAVRLRNVAGSFKGTSDPFAVVTKIATEVGTKPEVLGKTEVIKNDLSPNWAHVFKIDYELGSTTKLAVSIFDEVRKSENIAMGSAVFDLAEVLGSRGNTQAKRLPKGGGTLFLYARKSKGSGVLRLRMAGKQLKNVEGLFSKSDPFFEINRRLDAAGHQTWDNVYRSEFVKNNLNPEWKEAVVDLSILCEGDLDKAINISVYDHESKGDHTPMGDFETSVNGLKAAADHGQPMILKRKGKETGEILITKASVSGLEDASVAELSNKLQAASTTTASSASTIFRPGTTAVNDSNNLFLEYIEGGCEINVAVAIDFTGSNGDPRKPDTLHYLNSAQRNDYEKAISAIVSILSKYDTDKQFPVWGFGAKYDGIIQHCFECGDSDKHYGVKGVLDAYHSVFRSGLVMSGPTVFEEVIRVAGSQAKEAAKAKGGQCYTVLLILTDGAVSDVQATAKCLEEVSDAPLSVIIVGVGNADFSGMKFLDNFSGPGSGKRDIVQFVEFSRFKNNSHALTNETLNEIPAQLSGYFQKMNIQPNPPIGRSDSSVAVEEEEEEIDLSLGIEEEEIVVLGGGDDFVDGFLAS